METIRKATERDLDAVARIYDHIHDREEQGRATAGRGIGSRFVAFYEQYAKEHECTVLRMDTNARNRAARALYPKLGYREADILHCDFNGIRGVDLVTFEKRVG